MRLSACALAALGLGMFLFTSSPAIGATGVSLKFNDNVGTPNDGNVTINTPFTLSVIVSSADDTPNNRVQGLGYYFISTSTGVIRVNSRTVGPFYTDATPDDSSLAPFTLSPSGTPQIGSSFPGFTSYKSNGDYKVADFSITALATGNYTITFDESRYPNESYQPPTTSPGSDLQYASVDTYQLHVSAPEPACLSGIVLLLGAVARPRRRAA